MVAVSPYHPSSKTRDLMFPPPGDTRPHRTWQTEYAQNVLIRPQVAIPADTEQLFGCHSVQGLGSLLRMVPSRIRTLLPSVLPPVHNPYPPHHNRRCRHDFRLLRCCTSEHIHQWYDEEACPVPSNGLSPVIRSLIPTPLSHIPIRKSLARLSPPLF